MSQRRHGFLDDDRSRPRLLFAPAFPSQACRRVRSRITKLALARTICRPRRVVAARPTTCRATLFPPGGTERE
jgi:hypothetical protein